jgi:hypothetical protein
MASVDELRISAAAFDVRFMVGELLRETANALP